MVANALNQDDVLIINILEENLDAGNIKQFKSEILNALDGNPKAVLNLSPIRFLDSSGLGVLLSCLRRQHEANGDLKIAGLKSPALELFQLVRMDRIFELYDTVEDAARSF
ncbi:STAS domain-containing protein [bacterium]|nr:STAS domain-containing protein [bacterium]